MSVPLPHLEKLYIISRALPPARIGPHTRLDRRSPSLRPAPVPKLLQRLPRTGAHRRPRGQHRSIARLGLAVRLVQRGGRSTGPARRVAPSALAVQRGPQRPLRGGGRAPVLVRAPVHAAGAREGRGSPSNLITTLDSRASTDGDDGDVRRRGAASLRCPVRHEPRAHVHGDRRMSFRMTRALTREGAARVLCTSKFPCVRDRRASRLGQPGRPIRQSTKTKHVRTPPPTARAPREDVVNAARRKRLSDTLGRAPWKPLAFGFRKLAAIHPKVLSPPEHSDVRDRRPRRRAPYRCAGVAPRTQHIESCRARTRGRPW